MLTWFSVAWEFQKQQVDYMSKRERCLCSGNLQVLKNNIVDLKKAYFYLWVIGVLLCFYFVLLFFCLLLWRLGV